jgi:diguanylate cyclase (GGDEF)-like protein
VIAWGTVVWGTALGAVIGWLLARRVGRRLDPPPPPRKPQVPHSSDPPELSWLAQAHGALGIWLRRGERGLVQGVADPGVPAPLLRAVEGRLSNLSTPGGRTDVERLEEGALAFAASDDLQAAMLLPPKAPTSQAVRDLEVLLASVRTRGQLEAAVTRNPSQQERLVSVAVRLALEIERRLEAEVAIAVRQPRGAQVIATSVRADPHLQRIVAVPGSAVDLAVRGEVRGIVMAYDPLGVLPPDRRARERQAWVMPVAAADHPPVGAVVVWLPGKGALTSNARLELERTVGGTAARLEEAVSRQELSQQAVRDPLTGLLNRRGLTEAMGRIDVDQGSLVVLDLDHFKSLNDTLGHPAGDAALQSVAAVIADVVRETDTPARVGGEEFAIWIPGGSMAEGLAVAERLRAQVAAMGWGWQGREWSLTASLGVASWPETTRSRDNLMAQADSALYSAKTGGRNRVEQARLAPAGE